MESAVIKRSY